MGCVIDSLYRFLFIYISVGFVQTEKDIKNLRQEIGILRKLNHENIILMFDAFETDRDFCVVTEYAQGEVGERARVVM